MIKFFLLMLIGPSLNAQDTAENLETGKRIYNEFCIHCHGQQGEGDGEIAASIELSPRNFKTQEFKWGSTPSEIMVTLYSGRGDMPSFAGEISEDDLWAVSYFIRSFIPEKKRRQDNQLSKKKLSDYLKGNPPQSVK